MAKASNPHNYRRASGETFNLLGENTNICRQHIKLKEIYLLQEETSCRHVTMG
jgi:hypothetical protein